MKTQYAVLRYATTCAICALQLVFCSALTSCGGGGGYGGGSTQMFNPPPTVAESYRAVLTGGSETPPNASAATGTGALTLDTGTKMMTATVTTGGISGTMAHIHQAAVGVAGPIIFPLTETYGGSGVWSVQMTLTDEQIATLRAGNYYFNVHSVAFPAGEIRGQIVPQ
jgi:hypothetical protein